MNPAKVVRSKVKQLTDLPSIGKAARQPDQVLQLVIARDETIELKAAGQSSAVTLRDVAAAVRKAQDGQRDSAVVISADRNVRYELVVKVMDALQRAGIQRVGLSVQLVN